MGFGNEQADKGSMQSASSWQQKPLGNSAALPWLTLNAQLMPILAAPDPDEEALARAAEMLACWAEAQQQPQQGPPTEHKPAADLHSGSRTMTSPRESASFAGVNALTEWPSLDSTREESHSQQAAKPGQASHQPGRWSEIDHEGRLFAKLGGTGLDAEEQQCLAPDAAVHEPPKEAEKEKKPEVVELSIKEKNLIIKPDKVQWGRSTTDESRRNLAAAKEQLAQLRQKVKEKSATLRQVNSSGAGSGSQNQTNTGKRQSGSKKNGSGRSTRSPEARINKATNDLDRAKQKLETAERSYQKRLTPKNRDPIGEAEREEEQKREAKVKDRADQRKDLKKQIDKLNRKIEHHETKIENNSPASKNHQTKIAQLKKQKWDARKQQAKLVAAEFKDHTKVKTEGTIYKKEAKADSRVAVYDHKVEDQPSFLNSNVSGVTQLLVAKQQGEAEFKVGTDGVTAKAEYKGTAALLDFQRKWNWDFPHQLFGEDMNAKLFLELRGLVGAEVAAKVEANVSTSKPKGPHIDSNAIMAGVDAFAGAKVQVGAGAAYEWKKKTLKDYEPKLQNSAQALISVVSAVSGPVGYLLKELAPTSAVSKVLGWLLEHGSEGTVPLISLTAKGEASVGAGATAKAAIGLRKGKLVAQVKASATLGVGLGGDIELMIDIIEGPLFLLLTLGQPELQHMIHDYIADKIHRIAGFGIQLGTAIYDWFTSDDKARDLVAHNGHQVLAVPDRIVLIQNMLSGCCGDDDERAILTVLGDAKQRGDMDALVTGVGRGKLTWKIDGDNNDKLHTILGN